MYTREKPLTGNRHKNTPSFSSILLDEIYRSIDEDSKFCIANNANNIIMSKTSSHYENGNNTVSRIRRHSLIPESDNDLAHISNQSSHDDRSSSDTEMFGYNKTRYSNSFATRPKHRILSDEEEVFRSNHQRMNKSEDGSIKSKSRASKIYAQLKKLKQPISPGVRLTSFIQSLFNSDHQSKKKPKKKVDSKSTNDKAKSSTTSSSTCCSSDSSFSCDKVGKLVNQRTVRFDSASVVLDRESKHSTRKREGCDRLYMRKPPLPPDCLRGNRSNYYDHKYKYDDRDDEDDDCDGLSDSSSDLFELDHLAFYSKDMFEDLPVYETTRFDANRLVRVA